ncbi:bifunctional indole-3-glycerol-phosphate synthase TrpC/phosphoribosylanthranilate isomerase TrpF [Gallaecimonas sp. GXIMD4217]|uniref:bifunctional indole-3-glycerol-phosphate synthase TrpC/phosphoribosylanthranilate isomerase TrpF n=1 Tax=Gallaecimonas sp. GXIMD4217 TaxID=3131927 RepID=UPI00311B1F13
MAETILNRIVARKRADLPALKAHYPRALAGTGLEASGRSLYDAIKQGPGFILECKKASPSKGLIRDDFDLDAIATVYGRHASAISVLTDQPFFQGRPEYLAKVASRVTQPVLMKDFVIDPFQVRLGRFLGADAVLLMLSVLDDDQYLLLAAEAAKYQMDVLTEVANEAELDRALALGAAIIGINNRNLHDLSIDLARTEQLAARIPDATLVISESGIKNHGDVKRLRPHADGFLVGSELMKDDDLDGACRALIHGEHKVCGLTRPQDALAAYRAGALFGGLIFAPRSPRCLSVDEAEAVMAAAPLRYVGVFVNEAVEQVAAIAKELDLYAVQLHGDEDETYIAQLRQLTWAQLWRACTVDAMPTLAVDRLVVDSKHDGQFGGTGTAFDWSKLDGRAQPVPVMLAGGIGPDNCESALKVPGITGLDLNSKLESAPGLKCRDKINAVFDKV